MLPAMASRPARIDARRQLLAAVAWLGLAAAAAALLLQPRNPYWLVIPGAVLAFVVPERDLPGWEGFVSSSLVRVADTVLFGAIAWALGRDGRDVAGAAAATTLLSAALLSSYVRVRAESLGIEPGSPAEIMLPFERGARLALISAGLIRALVPLLWAAAGLALAVAAVRSVGVWRGASHG